jgi:hypothetical protein
MRFEKQWGDSPRLRAGSDANPGLRHTALIAMDFYLRSLHLYVRA